MYLIDNIPDRYIESYTVPLSKEFLYITKINAYESCKKQDSIEALDPSIRMMAWVLIEKANHYIQYLKDQEYTYGTIFLPHDADHEQLGQEKTIVQQFRAAFPSVRVVVVPRVSSKANSIEAARSIFSNSYFDKELCADGIQCLRRYCYVVDKETGKEIGFKWGDDFPTYNDYIHFEKADENGDFIQKIVRKD